MLYYLHQWNEVIIGGDYEIGRFICLRVCLCARIGGDMHSNERLLSYLLLSN